MRQRAESFGTTTVVILSIVSLGGGHSHRSVPVTSWATTLIPSLRATQEPSDDCA
jgi:hemolysin-activating ACP:hemolysin acyltransferase